jgi:mannuronan synthase
MAQENSGYFAEALKLKARLPPGTGGFLVYTLFLFLALALLPALYLDTSAKFFLAGLGLLALWRYSWGAVNYIRSLIYRKYVFPQWRRQASLNEELLLPSKIYLLITVFRIDSSIVSRVVKAALQEAVRCGVPVSIVASVVEMQDEFLFKTLFESAKTPEHIDLKIVRIAGTGKRQGLAHGFKTISRDMPPPDALVVVMDGDTVLLPGSLRKSVPFFKMIPGLGALTTDEISEVDGSEVMQDWHEMRFAQRQILMSSIALSRRVMTLTGRMSIFRADIIANPEFIAHVTDDHLDHWRLGRFKFLTGDDKSSLYWVMKKGYKQIYLPDTQVLTYDDPPDDNFIKSSTQLMFRWFGNMLRTNERIVRLGPGRMPVFVWWAFFDQRLSMWTTLAGPAFAFMLTLKYGIVFLAYYFAWVAFVRWVMTLLLLTSRPKLSWRYPFLLYYSQVYGALLKTWVLFRLDIQSWTRQKTKLQRGLTKKEYAWNTWTSHIVHIAALVIFVCMIGLSTNTIDMPWSALRHFSTLPGNFWS